MRQIITRIRGLTVNIEVVEVCQTDAHGGILWYYAAIWFQEDGSKKKTLVLKSRLPGAAAELWREIQRVGLWVFDRFGA